MHSLLFIGVMICNHLLYTAKGTRARVNLAAYALCFHEMLRCACVVIVFPGPFSRHWTCSGEMLVRARSCQRVRKVEMRYSGTLHLPTYYLQHNYPCSLSLNHNGIGTRSLALFLVFTICNNAIRQAIAFLWSSFLKIFRPFSHCLFTHSHVEYFTHSRTCRFTPSRTQLFIRSLE